MNWVIKVADEVQRSIDQLPPKARRQVRRSISQMEQDPFHGDVLPLHGNAWKGYYRKRTGDYRIVFFPHHKERIVDIGWVILRSEKAYL